MENPYAAEVRRAFVAPTPAHPAFHVSATHSDRALRVRLNGHLTAEVCPTLRRILLECRAPGEKLVLVDATDVTAVDDAVVSVLLAGAAFVSSAGGRLRMTGMSAPLRRALDVLGVAELLPVLTSATRSAQPAPDGAEDAPALPWGRGARRAPVTDEVPASALDIILPRQRPAAQQVRSLF